MKWAQIRPFELKIGASDTVFRDESHGTYEKNLRIEFRRNPNKYLFGNAAPEILKIRIS